MANNPIVLVIRFLLELAGLFALGYWGWTQHTGILRVLLVILIPLLAATVWGVFRVPGHLGRSLVPVPGVIRLLIELVFFGSMIWAFYASGQNMWGLITAIVIILHYVVSYDYVLKLVRGRS